MKAKLSFSLPNISIENGNTGVTPINGTIYFSNFIRGPKGDPFRFEDFTQEQLDSLRGSSGKGALVMDLDNSNQSVPCNDDGSILEGFLENGTITTKVVVYDEDTNVSFKWLFTVPTSSKYKCEVLQAYSNSNYGIITIKTITTVDTSIDIPIIATLGKTTFTKYLTITKIKGGKNAIMYSLQPSHNIIKRDKLDNVDPLKISCIEIKRVGNEPPLPVKVNRILYKIDDKGDFLNYPEGGIVTTNIFAYIDFRLVDTNQIVWDLERVPVVKDGTDGINGIGSYIMDLSNEVDAVPCENDGTILAGVELPSTLASIYYADTDDSSTWIFSAPTSPDYTVETSMVGYSMKVQVLTILKDEVRIVINAVKGGTVLSKIFTVTKVKGGADAIIFSLEPSVNVVKKDKAGILFPTTLSCYAKKRKGIGEISFVVPKDNKKILYIMNDDDAIKEYITSITLTKDDRCVDFFLINTTDYIPGVLPDKIFDKERVYIIEDGKDGDTVYIVDLSNETESIPSEDNGTIISGVTYPSTIVSVYKGLVIDTEKWDITITTSPDYTTTLTDLGHGSVKVNVTSLPSNKMQVIVPITVSKGNITFKKDFTITKVKGGKNAVIYSLDPNVNIITKDTNNIIIPTLISCKATKQIGSGIREVTTDKKIIYKKGDLDNLHTYISPIGITQSDKYIEFYLVEPNANIDTLPTIIFDREKIPVVTDGKAGLDGVGAYTLDLDNSNQSVSCDKNGTPLEDHPKLKTIAVMLNGDLNVSKDWIFSTSLEASLYCTIVQPTVSNNYTSIEITPTSTDFPISNILTSIPIYAEKNGVTYTKYISISKVLNGEMSIRYEVRPSSSTIKVSSDNTFMPNKISCTKWKTIGLEDPKEMDINDGVLKYRFMLSLDDGSITYSPYTIYTTPVILNYEEHQDAIELEFTLFKDSNIINPIILDYEGLPIIADGRPGPEGKTSSYLDLSNEIQSILADDQGTVIDSKTILESELRVFEGELNNSDGWVYSYDSGSITPSITVTITQYAIGTIGNKYGKITINATNMYANIDTVNIPIIATYAKDANRKLTKILTITKIKGGKDTFIFSIIPSVDVIQINKLNQYTPTSISCDVYRRSGDGIFEKLDFSEGTLGNLKITYTTPSGTYDYKGVALPTKDLSGYVEFALINTNGEITILDKERVPIISDGIDSFYLTATDSSIVAKTDSYGYILEGDKITKALVYQGPNDVTISGEWRISIVNNPNVNYSIQNNVAIPETYGTITITRITTTNTTLAIRAKKDRYTTLEYNINIASVKDGTPGDNGTPGEDGDNVILYNLICDPTTVYRYTNGSVTNSTVSCKVFRHYGSDTPVDITNLLNVYNKKLLSRASNKSSWTVSNGIESVGSRSWIEFAVVEYNDDNIIHSTYRVLIIDQGSNGSDGKPGEDGKPSVYIGDYDSLISKEYYIIKYISTLREVISRNGNYFWLKNQNNGFNFYSPSSQQPPTTATSNIYWENIEKFKVTATDLFFAEEAYIKNLGVENLRTSKIGKRIEISQKTNTLKFFDELGAEVMTLDTGIEDTSGFELRKTINGNLNVSRLTDKGLTIINRNDGIVTESLTTGIDSKTVSSIKGVFDIKKDILGYYNYAYRSALAIEATNSNIDPCSTPALLCLNSGIIVRPNNGTVLNNGKRHNNVMHGIVAYMQVNTGSSVIRNLWSSSEYPIIKFRFNHMAPGITQVVMDYAGNIINNYTVITTAEKFSDTAAGMMYSGICQRSSNGFNVISGSNASGADAWVHVWIIDLNNYI